MLFHITERAAWESAQIEGTYCPASLNAEGFIHFSTREQVIPTANRFYRGQTDLVLLQVEPSELFAPLRYEEVANHGTFPHLYGPLNAEAVIKVWPFNANADGCFTFPVSHCQ